MNHPVYDDSIDIRFIELWYHCIGTYWNFYYLTLSYSAVLFVILGTNLQKKKNIICSQTLTHA